MAEVGKQGGSRQINMARVESERSMTDAYAESATSSSYECASTTSANNTDNATGILPRRWAVWHYKRPAQGGRGRVEKVAVLGTQQELLTQLKEVNLFEQKDAVSVNVFVFRDGVKPDKFDTANKDGGCWAVFAPDDLDPANKTLVCQWWVKLLSMAVKELLDEHEDVMGVRVAIRNPQVAGASAIKDDSTVAQGLRDRVELWTKDAPNQEKQVNIGQSVKAMLGLSEGTKITYRAHQDIFIMKKKPQSNTSQKPETKQQTSVNNNNNNNSNNTRNGGFQNNTPHNRMNNNNNNNNNSRPIGFMGIRSTSSGRNGTNPNPHYHNGDTRNQVSYTPNPHPHYTKNNSTDIRRSLDNSMIQQHQQRQQQNNVNGRRQPRTLYELPPIQDQGGMNMNTNKHEKQQDGRKYNTNGNRGRNQGQGQGPIPQVGSHGGVNMTQRNNIMGQFLGGQNKTLSGGYNNNNSNGNGYRRRSFQGSSYSNNSSNSNSGSNHNGQRSRRASSEHVSNNHPATNPPHKQPQPPLPPSDDANNGFRQPNILYQM